jgi:hypothetical protein
MRQMKYLNVLLTVNAVLMTAVLWTQLADQPLLSSPAHAQRPPGAGEGVPNAGSQRQQMIEEIRGLRSTLEATKSFMEGGALKVQVTNLEELKTTNTK